MRDEGLAPERRTPGGGAARHRRDESARRRHGFSSLIPHPSSLNPASSLILYNLLLFVLSPPLALYLLWRLARGKEDRERWAERWGGLPANVAENRGRPRFWVHAVSVGEVMAAAPVLRELRARFPDAFLLLSTITPSGREVALKQVPPADEVVYFPLDFPFAVRRALAAARPDLVLLLEWEIWPNFLTRAKRGGAKIAVLNGRVSDRGLRRGRRGGWLPLVPSRLPERSRRVGEHPEKPINVGAHLASRLALALHAQEDLQRRPLVHKDTDVTFRCAKIQRTRQCRQCAPKIAAGMEGQRLEHKHLDKRAAQGTRLQP